MPRVIAHNLDDYTETTTPEARALHGPITGREVYQDSIESFEASLTSTGFLSSSLHEQFREASLAWAIAQIPLVGIEGRSTFMLASKGGADMLAEPFDYGYRCPIMRDMELPGRQTTTGISPLVQSQVEQIVTGVNAKIRERLFQFWNDRPGQKRVSASTKHAVQRLVDWLCSQSETVSVTVSSEGVLSVAAVFSSDVRLYVEIERDGSTEAAVTRKRRYARDISGDTISELTSEVILAAVRSV